MITSRIGAVAVLGMAFCGLATAWTSDVVSAVALGGITAVKVLVESLPPGANVIGLTKEQIQTDVELKLRMAGMRVTDETKPNPGGPIYTLS